MISTAPSFFKKISLLIFDLVLELDVATVLSPMRNLACGVVSCFAHYWLKAAVAGDEVPQKDMSTANPCCVISHNTNL